MWWIWRGGWRLLGCDDSPWLTDLYDVCVIGFGLKRGVYFGGLARAVGYDIEVGGL